VSEKRELPPRKQLVPETTSGPRGLEKGRGLLRRSIDAPRRGLSPAPPICTGSLAARITCGPLPCAAPRSLYAGQIQLLKRLLGDGHWERASCLTVWEEVDDVAAPKSG
jgi:hypothetical protein